MNMTIIINTIIILLTNLFIDCLLPFLIRSFFVKYDRLNQSTSISHTSSVHVGQVVSALVADLLNRERIYQKERTLVVRHVDRNLQCVL